jgi:hypothetical protein
MFTREQAVDAELADERCKALGLGAAAGITFFAPSRL